jgi:hypothetical protein
MIAIEAGRYGQLPVVAFHQSNPTTMCRLVAPNATWMPITACRNLVRADKGMLMTGLVSVQISFNMGYFIPDS